MSFTLTTAEKAETGLSGGPGEVASVIQREVWLTQAQLALSDASLAARLTAAVPDADDKPLQALADRLRGESTRRFWEDREATIRSLPGAVALSLDELYLLFEAMEAYEQQILGDKAKPLGETRTLIEELRQEMIRREMALGEIDAAIDLTPMGKALLAQISPDAKW